RRADAGSARLGGARGGPAGTSAARRQGTGAGRRHGGAARSGRARRRDRLAGGRVPGSRGHREAAWAGAVDPGRGATAARALAARLRRAMEAAGLGASLFWQLQCDQGGLLVVPAPSGILIVAVAEPDVNVGLVRLELLRAAEAVG